MINERHQSWIERAASQSGVLVCGVRLADRSTSIRTRMADFPERRVEEVLQALSDAVYALRQNQIPTQYLRWKFEHGEIHCALLRDGTLGAVIVGPDAENASTIESVLGEFLELMA